MNIQFILDGLQSTHTRKVYGFFDLLGEIGGIKEIILLIIGLVLMPFNEGLADIYLFKKLFKFKFDKNANSFKDFDISKVSPWTILCNRLAHCFSKEDPKTLKFLKKTVQKCESIVAEETNIVKIM